MDDVYKKIIEIMNKLNSSTNYQQLLLIIIDSAKELVNSEGASLLLLDEETGELMFDIVVSEKGEIIRGKRIKIGEGIAGYVAAAGEGLIVNDVRSDQRFCSDIDVMSGFRTRSLVATPVRNRGKLIGVLEAANANSPAGFTDNDLYTLQYLADAASVSINNRELLISLKNRADELTCIYEITQSIYFTFDVDEFLMRILHAVKDVLKAERCSFVILDETGKGVRHFVSTTGEHHAVDLSKGMIAHVLENGDPLLVYNIEEDSKIMNSETRSAHYGTKSFICVPMKIRERVTGVLNVTDKRRGEVFDSFDLKVLSAIANHVAETFENLLLQKKLVERENIEKELAIASHIQLHALPPVPEQVRGGSIGAFTLPSSYVGGDFYEISLHDDGMISVAVGDVSGHGIPAAIFMSMVRNTLRYEAMWGRDPAELIPRVNLWVCRESKNEMFCTYFYCVIDPTARRMLYSSAGHDEQLLYRSGADEFVILKTKGVPLGTFRDGQYGVGSVSYEPGDFLVLYTDGLIEEGTERPFTMETIMDFIRTHKSVSGKQMVADIRAAIDTSFREEYAEDDITLLVVKFE